MPKTIPLVRPAKLAGLLFLLPFSTLLAEGALEGRVSDQSGTVYFEGAIAALPELNVERVTDAAGRFRFQNLPAGDYRLEVSYVGAEPVSLGVSVRDDQTGRADVRIGSQVEMMENIIVSGRPPAPTARSTACGPRTTSYPWSRVIPSVSSPMRT